MNNLKNKYQRNVVHFSDKQIERFQETKEIKFIYQFPGLRYNLRPQKCAKRNISIWTDRLEIINGILCRCQQKQHMFLERERERKV